ncbi:MAG: chitobiase/beta-hexosaminidase C-terminal domain-containing protein [Mucilaginibacter sp.]|nr:chitobiase/beta-hexosaminidase C-terminal domain-containing protein [Mucilaginibacter sp.]
MIKNNYKGVAGNLLFALNIFIIVLVIAGDNLVIPVWLQPVGRLHPMILHFPIVLLILAMLMEFFRFKSAFANEKLYDGFTTVLLLSGAILAAVTAIMGLFLAREPGYDSNSVQWHKWFGVTIVFISSVIYWLRNASWYKSPVAQSGAVATVCFLMIAGHYGANITHGDNFVLGPVMKNSRQQVPIDQALVYRDVVQPIFETKCISCHNPDKLKGGLMLIDEKSVSKGGKSGKLFVPGQPQVSLLLERIHLPEEEKKHMPPSGKPQLTAAEMSVLYQWIKENADFKKKVTDLPATDSLRIAAALFLKPAEAFEERYDFAAADEKEVKKLNNNYRVIYELATGSPALAVNIYNKSTYNAKVLDELSPIKKQVVSIDLNKMPVKDGDLKTIARFENLRTLNLNFSDVTGSTLKDLSSLKYLRSLSLAGTKLNAQALDQLKLLKGLKEVVLWNTGLTSQALQAFQNTNKKLMLLEGFKGDNKPMKLIPPQVKNTTFVFNKPVQLVITNPIKGVDIRYTTDGSEPDSVKSALYKPGIMISDNTIVKAKAYKAGWYGSDAVSYLFYKNTFLPDSISLIKPVNERYQADGAKTLTDGELGGMSFGNNKWLGTQNDMEVMLYFKNPVKPNTLTLNCLKMIGSQIFLPTEVLVWGGSDMQHLKAIGSLKTGLQKKGDPDILQPLVCKLHETAPINCIKFVAKPIYKLPEWHPAKGKPSWVFVDEVFVN